MTSKEKDLLLSSTDPAADRPYIDAVNDLFSQPDSLAPEDDSLFLASSDISKLFNLQKDTEGTITPQRRYNYILRNLLPKLLNMLSY